MQKNLANIIVYGIMEEPLLEDIEMNRQIINNVVEHWHRNSYIVPAQALNVSRTTTYSSRYFMM